ncbi:M20 metallopeptidase family protein [Tindallia californiensis]|uniref:Amidohydrolase n=1 Tax=Tindallia californiensis TaxID=159292 RepID=A0A1H3LJ74_9FIRM|nr:amidohydrolase [Tindallia californiensis]SDY64597.1 amidohydrolase [Tindallia californiensis]
MDPIKNQVKDLKEELIALRRDFHEYPELGYQEHRTAQIVEEYLQELGIETHRMTQTGVTGMIKGKTEGPVLMLRADLDALPVQEENKVPYASKNPGVMHACGHDAHTAMLMVAAKVLVGMKDELKGNIKLVFQPNEENAGALPMINEGVLDNPKVDAVVGVHIWTPLPSGTIGLSAGGVMSGLDIFKILVRGYGGHSGYPETAIDPIIAASDIVLSAQRVQTREISCMKPTTMSFGKIEGGTKANIIPDYVSLEGSIRTLYDDGDDKAVLRLKRIAEKVAEAHHCECQMEWFRENIALINDENMVKVMMSAAREVAGNEERVVPHSNMASEDFSEFAALVPGVFIFLGTGNEAKETHYPHHNPRFNIDEDVMPMGVELFVKGALSYFKQQEAISKREEAEDLSGDD